jgi:hypothetical protein
MNTLLLRIGGAANAAFFLFHLWLGWSIHHWSQVPAQVRGLLEMFNAGSALFIGFFAYASLFRTTDLLESKLGRSVCWLVVLLYGTRAAGEFVFSPVVHPAIVAACLALAGLYLAVLLRPERSEPPHPAPDSILI